jgi:hypothetical protein
MKNFILAILIAILITYSFGIIANEWFDFNLQIDEHMFGPIESVAVLSVIGAIMAVVGVVVAVSVFGALLVGLMAGIFALVFAGIAMFWPMLLVIAIIIWLVKDNRTSQY